LFDTSTLSAAFHELTRPMAKVMRIIWFAFNGAILLYVVEAYQQFGWPSDGLEPIRSNPMTIPLVALSVVTAVASLWIGDLLIAMGRPQERFAQPPDPEVLAIDPRIGRPDPSRLARIKSLSEHEQRIFSLVSLIFVPFLVRLAFGESIALYGLVLSFLSRSLFPIVPFAIVSLALNLSVSPDLDTWLVRVTRRAGQ
jgi:hypothetical protein